MPSPQISKKKLKAIVFTDMADFTTISAQDGQTALDLIQKQNEIIKPIVEKHNGEWLKELGDGLLFSFDSSLEAVRCSIEIQETLKEIDDLNIRIGIHQGDIFIKDGDVFGDDVNITSRVESFSPTGGISISDKVNKDIAGVPDLKTGFIGHRKLKGVIQETKIYCIKSKVFTVHRTPWLPYMTGILMLVLGISGVIISTIVYNTQLPYYLRDVHDIEIPNFIVLEKSMYMKTLVRHFTFILFGYSNIMYVHGISSKTHRYFVYGSYVIMILLFFGAVFAVLNAWDSIFNL